MFEAEKIDTTRGRRTGYLCRYDLTYDWSNYRVCVLWPPSPFSLVAPLRAANEANNDKCPSLSPVDYNHFHHTERWNGQSRQRACFTGSTMEGEQATQKAFRRMAHSRWSSPHRSLHIDLEGIRKYRGSSSSNTLTYMRSVDRWWNSSWTAEACSFILSIITLAGLVATLLVHQRKPLPQWPQLITINSVISLFSMVMRASVGVVLTEGDQNLTQSSR